MDIKPIKAAKAGNNEQQADSENKNDIQQHEKLIDPGNEHSHHVDDEQKPGENKGASDDADGPPY